ncbi:hypothetical protein BKA61DRAFT_582923 [Leptodontidium sp. MPI-SDFR-AT-0119]|nr:hypothetical protein BKA61DRAFT_582923 [Leptodontidium sp. MPI-SDFR-AT-0119]
MSDDHYGVDLRHFLLSQVQVYRLVWLPVKNQQISYTPEQENLEIQSSARRNGTLKVIQGAMARGVTTGAAAGVATGFIAPAVGLLMAGCLLLPVKQLFIKHSDYFC